MMKRISAYFRPESIGEAFALLDQPGAVLIGGGTKLNLRTMSVPMSVVDLQLARLDGIDRLDDDTLSIGATTTLQQLVDSEEVPAVVRGANVAAGKHRGAIAEIQRWFSGANAGVVAEVVWGIR